MRRVGWRGAVLLAAAVQLFGGHALATPDAGASAAPEQEPAGIFDWLSGRSAEAKKAESPGTADPVPASQPASQPTVPAEVAALRRTASQIQDLIAEKLELGVDPPTLFEVPLDSEDQIRVETERLRAIVERAGRSAPDAGLPDAGPPPRRRRPPRRARELPPDAGVAPDASPYEALRALDPVLYAARVELDRTRLGFYLIGKARRDKLLARHAERQHADTSSRAQVEVSEAKRRMRTAASDRLRALEAAKRAKSEAERMVAEERARLLGVAGAQAELDATQVGERQALKARAEKTLGLRRRVRDAVAAGVGDSTVAADALYLELRTWLRATRAELADALAGSEREIPVPGEDRLVGLSVDVDRRANDRKRAELGKAAAALRSTEETLRWDRTTQLEAETRTLNDSRLQLLAHLSASRRSAITGFGSAGADQAVAELRQLTLVVGYHLKVLTRWISDLRGGGTGARGRSAMAAGWVAVKWLLVLVAFLWWRRRAQGVLERWRDRVREEDRRDRRTRPSFRHRGISYLLHVRRPLEWLLFWLGLLWFLPTEAKGLFEVEILFVVVGWTLGGSLAVLSIDAVASGVEAVVGGPGSPTAQLRLRSLRLVGRTVVVVGLILAISEKIVGQGTIYSWVLSTCWFAAIPVFLVIIRWWRDVIFRRMERFRRKRAFFRWVVDHQTGWKSFPAAVSGGAFLFASGAVHVARAWLGGFDVTRRLLAYLFRRGLDKMAVDGARVDLRPLPQELFSKLSPAAPSAEILTEEAEADEVAAVIRKIKKEGGGVYAVVGERGGGKSTVLRRVRDALAEVSLVDCPIDGIDALRLEMARALRLDEGSSLAEAGEVANAMNARGADPALLIDNVHRLVQLRMGGLAAFDRLLDVARHWSSSCTWVFAIDDTIWRFFESARGARPAFDDVITLSPWPEFRIAALLTSRTREAGIVPRFDHLTERLPADADELDREEALARTEASYYRLLWDYSAGNPGVALHMWRRSLGVDDEENVFVKLFRAPETVDLERLPDRTIFVLRAVVQLELARAEEIVRTTMLPAAQVENAIRYGLARGYFEEFDGRYRVSWGWFRAATRMLQRRHLLPAAR